MSVNGRGAGVARVVPSGDDRVWREIAELKRLVQQNLAAMRVMVDPLAQAIADLEEQQTTLSGVVDDLATQQSTLSGVVSDLGTAQSDLADVVADLGTAQSTLADLVATQVSTAVGNATVSGITVPSSYTGYAPVTVTVPSGFTKCAILATASASPYVSSPGGSGGAVNLRVDIGGTTGSASSSGWLDEGEQRTVSASHARAITGLSGGSTVTTQAQLQRTAGDPTADFLMVSLVAIFTH